jgi:hypothetical protein
MIELSADLRAHACSKPALTALKLPDGVSAATLYVSPQHTIELSRDLIAHV